MIWHDSVHVTFLCWGKNYSNQNQSITNTADGGCITPVCLRRLQISVHRPIRIQHDPHRPIRIKIAPSVTNKRPVNCLLIVEPWILNTKASQALPNAIKQRIALKRFIFQLFSMCPDSRQSKSLIFGIFPLPPARELLYDLWQFGNHVLEKLRKFAQGSIQLLSKIIFFCSSSWITRLLAT